MNAESKYMTITETIAMLQRNGGQEIRIAHWTKIRRDIQQSAVKEVWVEIGKHQADDDWVRQCLMVGCSMARNEYCLMATGHALPLNSL